MSTNRGRKRPLLFVPPSYPRFSLRIERSVIE
jgi:hypothetical protein